MPSSSRSARLMGTRDSTSVQSPLVKASTSAAFMRLPPLPLALACVSCRGVPDIILVHCGGWAYNAKFPLENETFKDYTKRLRERDAFKRAAALP